MMNVSDGHVEEFVPWKTIKILKKDGSNIELSDVRSITFHSGFLMATDSDGSLYAISLSGIDEFDITD